MTKTNWPSEYKLREPVSARVLSAWYAAHVVRKTTRTVVVEIIMPRGARPTYVIRSKDNLQHRMEEPREETQRCPKCGSADCQMLAWVRVNGSELIADADPPSDEVYCPKCNVTFHYAELKEG